MILVDIDIYIWKINNFRKTQNKISKIQYARYQKIRWYKAFKD